MNKISERIKELRLEKELTQPQLGNLLGLSRKAISHYENGATQPTLETVINMCKIFEVSADYLLGLEND